MQKVVVDTNILVSALIQKRTKIVTPKEYWDKYRTC